MTEVFVKKYWEENDITFYLHFKDSIAVAQIEVLADKVVLLSTDSPQNSDHFLYDQTLEELDLEAEDFISRDAFMEVWNSNKTK